MPARDESNGYEAIAQTFMRVRNGRIGAETVRHWSKALPRGASVLELGCGHGVPVSQVLIDEGFALYAVDASATLLGAFRERFPDARTECCPVEDSEFFGRSFDGVVAWGLMFLLPAEVQKTVIAKVARALIQGGKFLFTSPQQTATWPDALTGCESISLGADSYRRILHAAELVLTGEGSDEGENHYYFASKR